MKSSVLSMVGLLSITTLRHCIVRGFSLLDNKGGARSLAALRMASSGASGGRVSNSIQDKDLLSKTTKRDGAIVQERLDTNPPKGTRDFYPEDMRLRNWLFDHFKAVALSHGFLEYDAPVLESEALYTRKAGEEVTEQLYNFVDKGQRAVALRPEMTPSLARMVMAKKGGLPLPLKWFSIPQCWRYERMTRGRRREHFQWNMDIWGVAEETAEIELIRAMVSFFQRVGLTAQDVGIKVNSRLVIGEVLTELGIPSELFAATCVLVDKLEKVPVEELQGDLKNLGIDPSAAEKLMQVLNNKSVESLRTALGPESPAVRQLVMLFDLAEAYGIADWLILDASVVRGLAYYTGVVFEAFDRRGELRAVAGGGRYDRLLETFGGDLIPAVGFGFGDAVIVELLRDRGLLPTFQSSGIDCVIFSLADEESRRFDYYRMALEVTDLLRECGLRVDLVLESKKPKWVFKHADRLGAKFCIVIGSEEFARREVAIKNLSVGSQEAIKIEALSDWAERVAESNNREQ